MREESAISSGHCIIPCGKTKIWDRLPDAGPTPARHVYRGGLSGSARLYAERFFPDRWIILSAKYGYLLPDDVVPATYDVTFRRKDDPVIADAELEAQAARIFRGVRRVDVIAPGEYLDRVRASLDSASIDLRAPLERVPGHFVMRRLLREAREAGCPL